MSAEEQVSEAALGAARGGLALLAAAMAVRFASPGAPLDPRLPVLAGVCYLTAAALGRGVPGAALNIAVALLGLVAMGSAFLENYYVAALSLKTTF